MPPKPRNKKKTVTVPRLEATLWAAADKLRGHMDAAEYKHAVLGLIFLKYISDAFEEHQNKVSEEISTPESELYLDREEERAEAVPEDRDEDNATNVFWVPRDVLWVHLSENAKWPTIGKTLDDAIIWA